MSNTVITISRQYGSGGRELSEILAKKLGVKLYDRQIIHMAAAMLGIGDLTDESLRELEKYYHFLLHSCHFILLVLMLAQMLILNCF